MKNFYLFILNVLILFLITGCGVIDNVTNQPSQISLSNIAKNISSLQDGVVSFHVLYNKDVEFKINTSDWKVASENSTGAYISISSNLFQEGTNTVSVRSVIADKKGQETVINIYKGYYSIEGGLPITKDLYFKYNGNTINDVLVNLFTSSIVNDQKVYLLPDDNGKIAISGGTSQNSVLVLSNQHEMYLGNVEMLSNINIRDVSVGTKIKGNFLKRTDGGTVPFDSNDGEVWLHPHYNDGAQFVGAQDMHTHGGNSDDYAKYNNDGSYEINHLEGNKDYEVLIFWTANGIQSSTSQFNLPAGTEEVINITLESRKGWVTGDVKNFDASGAADASVSLTKVDSVGNMHITYNMNTFADSNGYFEIETFYGNYEILAGHSGEIITDNVTINETTANISLTLPAPMD
jgi:hypothetical protein